MYLRQERGTQKSRIRKRASRKLLQKAKKQQVVEEITRPSPELEPPNHAAELASSGSGFKPSGISERGKFGDLVKAIAGVTVPSNSDSAKASNSKDWKHAGERRRP